MQVLDFYPFHVGAGARKVLLQRGAAVADRFAEVDGNESAEPGHCEFPKNANAGAAFLGRQRAATSLIPKMGPQAKDGAGLQVPMFLMSNREYFKNPAIRRLHTS
jgi:hypothetical protein